MLEAMSIEENADDANQVLYIEYDLTNKKNHSQPVRKPQRPVKYTVIVDGKLCVAHYSPIATSCIAEGKLVHRLCGQLFC